jgi:hypothetical protein
MKHRMTRGFGIDAAETAALTVADLRATERIVEACDWRQIRTKEKNRIDNALRRLNAHDRAFARAVLGGKSWRDLGVSRQAFSVRLKKVEKVISAR